MVNVATTRPVTKLGREKYLSRKLFEREWTYCDPDSDPMPAVYRNDHANVRIFTTRDFPLGDLTSYRILSLLGERIVGYRSFAHRR